MIAANFGQYLEKVMGGLVSGAWVVTRRFVDVSFKKGQWANTKAFICDDLVSKHKQRKKEHGNLFQDVKAVLVLTNLVQSKVYTRLL